MQIRVGTFNILNTSCKYQERKKFIIQTIAEMDCDILGLQELNFESNFELINNDIYNFEYVSLPFPMLTQDPEFRIDGNGCLIRKNISILEKFQLVYSNNLRVAQILKLQKAENVFIYANTHLDHLSDETREIQLRELLEYLQVFYDQFPIICTGDFNFKPNSLPYSIMSQVFRSAHLSANEDEPLITFPTNLVSQITKETDFGCFDYIWIKGFQCLNSRVFEECGKNEIWASDHFPVISELQTISKY